MKIVFFCGQDRKFLGDIVNYLSQKHTIRFCEGKTILEMAKALDWCDVAWFEWCGKLAYHGSMMPKVCKMVCRLHRFEAFTEAPKKVNWTKFDDLIFVAPYIRDFVRQQVPDIDNRVKTHVIHNGVNLGRFLFRKKTNGFNIAFVAYLHPIKNLPLLLQCIKQLVKIDSRYQLHIAGSFGNPETELYFKHLVKELNLRDNINIYGWIDDINNWLKDKNYLISVSIIEGCPLNIVEAMATGAKPLIHNFPGADTLYPRKYLFNTIDECIQMVLSEDYDSEEYRNFVKENYNLTTQLDSIEKIIQEPSKSKSNFSPGIKMYSNVTLRLVKRVMNAVRNINTIK